MQHPRPQPINHPGQTRKSQASYRRKYLPPQSDQPLRLQVLIEYGEHRLPCPPAESQIGIARLSGTEAPFARGAFLRPLWSQPGEKRGVDPALPLANDT